MPREAPGSQPFLPVILKIGLVLFGVELAIMTFLPLAGLRGIWENLADAFLLVLLAGPALYFACLVPGKARAEGSPLPFHRAERWTLCVLFAQALLVVIVVCTDALVDSEQSFAARVINVAGRQRALGFQLAAEASSARAEEARDPSGAKQRLAGLRARADGFERVLAGLIDGDAGLDLPPCGDHAARERLREVRGLWPGFRRLMLVDLPPSRRPGDPEVNGAGQELFEAMDDAVGLLEKHYERQGQLLEWTLRAVILAACVISVFLIRLFLTLLLRRRCAEESLRASEGKYRHIIESAGEAIVTLDDHGLVCEFHPAAETAFGCAKKEV